MVLETIGGWTYITWAGGSQRLALRGTEAFLAEPGGQHVLFFRSGAWTCDCADYQALRTWPEATGCRHIHRLESLLNILASGVLLEHSAMSRDGPEGGQK